MKGFMKTFILSFAGFMVAFSGLFIGIDYLTKDQITEEGKGTYVVSEEASSDQLDAYVKEGKRLNILLLGADGGRSDTLMVLSLDMSSKGIKILSVPRDTYYHVEGYDKMAQRKINAVYGHSGDKGGVVGAKKAVETLTKMEIPYYVEVDYNAVMEIVDLLGGVDYEVPFDMDYDDPYAKPPLHIHLKKGMQNLDGQKAMQFLRWRKNNGSEGTGDIDRIKRQQEFMTAAAKKALGLKLPMVIKTAYENMKTNFSAGELIYLATKMAGTDLTKLEKYTLPGDVGMKSGTSFLLPNEAGIGEFVTEFMKMDKKIE